ncbi:Hpt domain-containing protein [Jannaschia pohangensis]|uniref:Hpt domain-containing protein n=1 Tax=Jannaschia pohangensis TaxID=390807 RepID=A0A1I3UDA4_9RHOB|nr:Hpt domain-containing protein [Jannaschia pohangensis]SFJ79767.1 Hpt domain-containing protein [Jannaschia pohangensis]
MIDTDRLAELESEIGAEDLGFIIAIYLEEADEMLARIDAGLSDEDHARALHFLRSGALNIGLRGVARASAELENSRDVSVPEETARLRTLLEESRVRLGTLLDAA